MNQLFVYYLDVTIIEMFKIIVLKKLSGDDLSVSDRLYVDKDSSKVEVISEKELVERFAKHSPDSLGIDWFRAESREVGIIINDDGTTCSANNKANELDLKQKMFKKRTFLNISDITPLPVIIQNNDISVISASRQFNIKFSNGNIICNDTSDDCEENAPILSANFIKNEVRNKRYNKQPADFELDAEGNIITSLYKYRGKFYYLIYCYSSNSFAYKSVDKYDESDTNYSTVQLAPDAIIYDF